MPTPKAFSATSSRRSLRNFCSLLAIPLAALVADRADAHLGLIRQQWESAGTIEAYEHLGRALASGDFDGDGFDDLATGAPNDDANSPYSNVGTVVVNYGSKHGLTHVGAQALTFIVPENGIRFGHALASGDFNDDGFDDLVVGMPFKNAGTTADAGAIRIFPGSANGLSFALAVVYDQTAVGGANEAGDLFGWSLTTGNFNGDAYDDLVVGGPGEDAGEGAVYTFWGSDTGLAAGGFLKQSDLGGIGTAMDSLGYALTAGQLVGSSHDDLAIGVPFADAGALDSGRLYVVPGGATGLVASGAFARDEQNLGLAPTPGGRFGWSLQTGLLLNSTLPMDLAVGEPGHGPGDNGRVLVIGDIDVPGSVVEILQSSAGSGELSEFFDLFGYSLAAGDWDDDGDDELLVGSPGETVGTQISAGLIQLFERVSPIPFPGKVETFDGARANDLPLTGFFLGWDVAFGRFDNSGRANIAAGAPGADFRTWEMKSAWQTALGVQPLEQAGQVHVMAPWRHPDSLQARVAAVTNCQNELVFSIRPFDPTEIASTTKTMTVLLAAEAIQNDPMIDSTDVYTVPCWVANCFSGSQAGPPLQTGEQVRLIDLMRLAMIQSAGDACLAIADHLTGGVDPFPLCFVNPPDALCLENEDIVLPTFVARMNQRAQQLGMSGTEFTNPHGSTCGTALGLGSGQGPHHSTAFDLAILGRAAMQNALFAETVRRQGWTVNRVLTSGPVNVPMSNGYVTNVHNALLSQLVPPDSLFSSADGVKPGGNTYANNSGIGSAVNSLLAEPHVVAASSGTGIRVDELFDSWGTQRTNGIASMLAFALSRCMGAGPGGIKPPPPPEDPGPHILIPDIPADAGAARATGVAIVSGTDVAVDLVRQAIADSAADVEMTVSHQTLLHLAPGERATLGIAPFDAHAGFRILNTGGRATYRVTLSAPPATSYDVVLSGMEGHLIPAASAPGSGSFTITLTNMSSTDTVQAEVEEIGYIFQVDLAGSAGAVFSAQLERFQGLLEEEQVAVVIRGQDATPGNTLTLVVRDPHVVVAVPEGGPASPPPAPIAYVRTYPNPFNPTVTIEFEIARPEAVQVQLFDVSGRHVRTLAPVLPRLDAGRHQLVWDGRDDRGAQAPSGLYFYRLVAGDAARSGRLVLVK